MVIGNVTKFAYDIENNLTKVTTPDGKETQYTYSKTEADGNTVTTTDALGHKAEEKTNLQGQTSLIRDLGNGTITPIEKAFTYAENKDIVIKEQDKEGNYRTFEYDGKDRLIKKRYYQGGVETMQTQYAYDLGDNITLMKNYKVSSGSLTLTRYTSHTYDFLKRLTTFAEWDGPTEPTAAQLDSKKTTYTYDIEGNIETIDYPDTGSKVQGLTFDYNEHKWLTDIKAKTSSGEEQLRVYTYNELGRVEAIKDYPGFLEGSTGEYIQRNYQYDAFDRPTAITYTDESGGQAKEAYTYSYDKNDQIITEGIKNLRPAEAVDQIDESRVYAYDNLGRLAESVTSDALRDSTVTKAYTGRQPDQGK